jgi:hypothetical protein
MKTMIIRVITNTPPIANSFPDCRSDIATKPSGKMSSLCSHDRARTAKKVIITKLNDIAIQGNFWTFVIGDCTIWTESEGGLFTSLGKADEVRG